MSLLAQEESLAPNFEMKLLDDTKVELADYKDKVVYISFWASWCRPCISNFKKYQKIRSSLEKEGVILLNVSIDTDEFRWKQALEKLDINGIHGIARAVDLYSDYDISSIPQYEIVNKKGFFVYLSDETDRDIIGQFKNWIEE